MKYQIYIMRLNNYIIAALLFLFSDALFAQTKEELKNTKLEIEKQIKYTSELLKKTSQNKKKSLNYLQVLEGKIQAQEKLLSTLSVETVLLNKQIKKTEHSIKKIEDTILLENQKLDRLKKEYAKMIYVLNKHKKNSTTIFILSAENFNQAYKRVLYLRQYASYRKSQAKNIEAAKKRLKTQKDQLVNQKKKLVKETGIKQVLVESKRDELNRINNTKEEREQLIKSLSKSEKLFSQQIKEKELKRQELDKKIRKIIEEEIRIAKEEAKKNNLKSNRLTSKSIILSSEFIKNKGKLPWPLESGIIINRYGTHKHAVFNSVETFNNGIDIVTEKNALVRAVFKGKVSRIFFIKGEGKAILINHGEYFSVYSGLKDVSVKEGDEIRTKEKIGVLKTDEEQNRTELHFEIWKSYEKQDPSKWLYNAD